MVPHMSITHRPDQQFTLNESIQYLCVHKVICCDIIFGTQCTSTETAIIILTSYRTEIDTHKH